MFAPGNREGNSGRSSIILSFYDVVTALFEGKVIIGKIRVLDSCPYLLTCRAIHQRTK